MAGKMAGSILEKNKNSFPRNENKNVYFKALEQLSSTHPTPSLSYFW